ncbi:MAG: NUDIX domain-containing protein [Nitrospirota bacterium]|nr:NUDIX domain-containing protein [Nitrospirota bacterium]
MRPETYRSGGPTDHELLDIVDSGNRVIGQATRREIHERGLMHRSVHVFLVDPQSRLYIQKRAASKETFPGAHDSSAAGHVNAGEDYFACAVREVEEELGLSADQHRMVQICELEAGEDNGWEHVRFYVAQTSHEPTPDPVEVAHGAFYDLDQVEDLIADSANHFAPTFRALYILYATRLHRMVESGDLFRHLPNAHPHEH